MLQVLLWRLVRIRSLSQFTYNRNNQITDKNISSSSTTDVLSQDVVLTCTRPTQHIGLAVSWLWGWVCLSYPVLTIILDYTFCCPNQYCYVTLHDHERTPQAEADHTCLQHSTVNTSFMDVSVLRVRECFFCVSTAMTFSGEKKNRRHDQLTVQGLSGDACEEVLHIHKCSGGCQDVLRYPKCLVFPF